jgi:uncharacterized membrane protein (UPF0127 family)
MRASDSMKLIRRPLRPTVFSPGSARFRRRSAVFVLLFAGLALAPFAPRAPLLAQTLEGGPPLEDLARFPKTTFVVHTGNRTESFNIWVADTQPREEQGLMFVRDLPADQGMLFVERAPRVASMWMKNTYIELDMLFIRADGRIAAIFKHTKPFSLDTITAGEPVMAVLEIKGGEAERRGIKVGDVVTSPALNPTPARHGANP